MNKETKRTYNTENKLNKGQGKRIPKKILMSFLSLLILVTIFGNLPINAFADEYSDARAARMNEVVQSNTIPDWPQGPQIGAEGAILMEARTGAVLYAKNIDERLYPASTTKIMTGLLA